MPMGPGELGGRALLEKLGPVDKTVLLSLEEHGPVDKTHLQARSACTCRQNCPGWLDRPSSDDFLRPGWVQNCPGWLDRPSSKDFSRPGWLDRPSSNNFSCPAWLDRPSSSDVSHPGWLDRPSSSNFSSPGWPEPALACSTLLERLFVHWLARSTTTTTTTTRPGRSCAPWLHRFVCKGLPQRRREQQKNC